MVLDDRIKVGQVARIDAFHAAELGCNASLLNEPGLHVLPSERRTRPGWGGYTVPILALSTASGGIVSARPDLLDRVRTGLGPGLLATAPGRCRVHAPAPGGPARDPVRLQPERPRPLHGQGPLPASADPRDRLERSDPRGTDLRRRFDGEIFVVWSIRGEVASWSAIKLKSDDVWEIAVVTEAPFRGQGLAKEVVSAATAHILEQGRLALYVHDRTNLASARVCRSLGYVEYAEEFFSEY